jgi:colanic acid biosynthesis glycosyl transferase WcaI
MRIHLITNLFAPDELAGAALYTDMAAYLRERGHDLRVTTTFAYYPAWSVAPADKGVNLRDEIHGSIQVRRIKMYIPRRVTGVSRLLSDFSFLLSLLRWGTWKEWRPEVVVTASPMLSQCVAQRFLYPGKEIPRLIIIQDFVVDAALELGILRLPLIATLLNAMQRWALRSAQTLSTISPLMLEKLRNKIGPDRRAVFIPNWIHQSLQNEIDRQLSVAPSRSENVLIYSGNFGRKQGLPDFLDQFRTASNSILKWNLEIYGGGAEKNELASAITANPSVKLGGVQDERAYVGNLLRASACLVTQRPGVGANFLPSKLLPALATGTPVLAVCDPDSPLGKEVAESGCGEVTRPGDSAALHRVLRKWQEHPDYIAEMSRQARKRAALYQRDFVLGRYETELEMLTRGSGASLTVEGSARTKTDIKSSPPKSSFSETMNLRGK